MLGLGLALAAVLGWTVLSPVSAKKRKPLQFASFSAPAFTPLEYSEHNNNASSVCVDFQDRGPGDFAGENNGDLDTKTGSYLEHVQLPQNAKVKRLSLFVNDNDGDDDAYVFLIRKRIQNGLTPAGDGYEVMAQTNSLGAVNNVLQQFSDTSVAASRITNKRYYYFLELVNCAVIEPYAVQIAYR